jgi:hypothetical protein
MKSKPATLRPFALVLAAAALVLSGCGAGDDDAAPAPGAPGETVPGEAPPAEEGVAGDEATMVELEEHEGSGYTGSSVLTPDGDAVYVDIEVRMEDEALDDDDAAFGDEDTWEDEGLHGLAAEIRSGTCTDPGETVRPVARLQFGWGVANLDMSLSELTERDHVMVITRSETAAARDAEDPFGEDDAAAPGDDDPAETTDDVTLEDDRQIVACGSIEAGVSSDWGDDLTEDDDTADDDEWDDDEPGDEDDDG